MSKYSIGDLVEVEDYYSGYKYTAVISSKGHQVSEYSEGRPVHVETIINYRCISGGKMKGVMEREILRLLSRGIEDV